MEHFFRYLIALSLSFYSFSVFSQSNYVSGSITDYEGNTRNGLINYKNWEFNPKTIQFKQSEGQAEPEEVLPENVKELRVGGEIYVGRTVMIETSPHKISELDTDPEIELAEDQVFLQVLFQGEKSLYYYKHRTVREYFYIEQNDSIVLLEYKKFIKEGGGTHDEIRNVTERRNYATQLQNYLTDCSETFYLISKTSYKKKYMTQLFEQYYKCRETTPEFELKKDFGKVKFGLVAGATYTILKFKSSVDPEFNDPDMEGSVDFAGGISVEIIFPRNREKWSLYNELLYTSFDSDGNFQDRLSSVVMNFNYSYLHVNSLVRYKFIGNGLDYFVNAGLETGLIVGGENTRTVVRTFDPFPISGPAMPLTRDFELGFIVGAGVKLNKVLAELRYNRGDGFSGDPNTASGINRFMFLVTYQF